MVVFVFEKMFSCVVRVVIDVKMFLVNTFDANKMDPQ